MKAVSPLALCLALSPLTAMAQSYDDLAKIELLPGWRTETGDHIAALRITLQPGWVTYWRAPGDAGIPPQITFRGDPTITSITPRWPTPAVFGEDGMLSIGYHDGVTVPLEVALADNAGAVAVAGEITIGVCEEICIPVTMDFNALLPETGSPHAAIAASLAQQPITAAAADVGAVTCAIAPLEDGLQVTARIDIDQRSTDEHVVIEAADPRVWVSEADVSRIGDMLTATVEMIHPSGQPFALERSTMRITVLGGGPAVDIRGCSAG
ncbi:protein-disulfide reductase DsbD domain-containing protein [Yoonia sp.]|uniref:protein-disulfide reductase DsbD domain-containing protein n=1 Tax=Yoonia sp. TaxID=2212373 RepID=UPI002FDA72CD